MTPFAVGASDKEKATIQAGVDRYNVLRAELMGAKSLYEEEAHTSTTPASQAYFVSVADSWKSQNSAYRAAKKHFRSFTCKVKPGSPDGDRRFAVSNAKASFVVAKDGACYEDMPLDVKKLLVPGLRLWASVLRLPYASRMRRAELEEALKPVLEALVAGPKR
jgi:hypothetical protein